MRDEIDGRLWQAHHQEFSADAARAANALGAAIMLLGRPAVALLSAVLLATVTVTAAVAGAEAAVLVTFA